MGAHSHAHHDKVKVTIECTTDKELILKCWQPRLI